MKRLTLLLFLALCALAGAAAADELPHAVFFADNILLNARVEARSGAVSYMTDGECLVDGSLTTKWCARAHDVDAYVSEDARHFITLDMGRVRAFDAYTLVMAGALEDTTWNMTHWELWASVDHETWTCVDSRSGRFENVVSFDVGLTSARYLSLRVIAPDQDGVGTVRLHEMMAGLRENGIADPQRGDSEYQIVFIGQWNEQYKENIARVFYDVYPRLIARWGLGGEPRLVCAIMKDWYGNSSAVAATSQSRVMISAAYSEAYPFDMGFFAHELQHVVQSYEGVSSQWWIENMANYARYRYFACCASEHIQLYDELDAGTLDWGWQPYGRCEPFFAYLDAAYPTRALPDGGVAYGLIDSIHRAFRQGALTSDGGAVHQDAAMNALVKSITGFDTMEAVRRDYARRRAEGTWSFTGFGGYEDNAATPLDIEYIALPTLKTNVFLGAKILSCSGSIGAHEVDSFLVDGDLTTKWCARKTDATTRDYMTPETQHYILLDLGAPRAFSNVLIAHAGTRETSSYNTRAWELLASNDLENWTTLDSKSRRSEHYTLAALPPTTARYVLLRVLQSDNRGEGTVRIYEMMGY